MTSIAWSIAMQVIICIRGKLGKGAQVGGIVHPSTQSCRAPTSPTPSPGHNRISASADRGCPRIHLATGTGIDDPEDHMLSPICVLFHSNGTQEVSACFSGLGSI